MNYKEFIHYKNLVIHKAWADFRSDAERTYLGVAWWVIEPLVDMVIYYLVFDVFLGRGGPDFIAFLLIGLVVWRYFSATVQRAANSILLNVNLIRQLSFRKIIFPIIAAITCSIEFVFSLLLLFIFLFLLGYDLSVHWLAFPALLIMLGLLSFGCGLFLSAFVPFLPDLQKLIGYVLRIVFFMSGILYKVSDLPEKAQHWLQFNPMVGVVSAFREPLLNHRWPDWNFVAQIALASMILVLAGGVFINRFDPLFAKRITR